MNQVLMVSGDILGDEHAVALYASAYLSSTSDHYPIKIATSPGELYPAAATPPCF